MPPSLPQRAAALRARLRPAEEAARAALDAIGRGWRRFRRATDRYRLLTDVLGGLMIVALVVGGLAAATGGVWPPIVIVESGSMMHTIPETDYGRVGSIDVGDIVFIRAVGRDGIETWADGGEDHYGRPGDVIAFWPDGNRVPGLNKTVLHRAIAYVEVGGHSVANRTYTLHWVDGEKRVWDARGIYFPPLGFSEDFGFSPNSGYRPAYSGYITKGDNGFTNPASDQALGISRVVDPVWIVGTVYGEIPWIGLPKLALQSETNPAVPNWNRVGNAFAPLELWMMLFVTLATIILVPLAFDTWRAWKRVQRARESARLIAEEQARRAKEREAAQRAAPPKRVTTFAAVVSSRPARPTRPGGPPPGR